jgi:hypothetical protein
MCEYYVTLSYDGHMATSLTMFATQCLSFMSALLKVLVIA